MSKEEYLTNLYKKYSYIKRPRKHKVGTDDLYHWSEAWYDKAERSMIKDFREVGFH